MNWRNINDLNAVILRSLPKLRGIAADCVVGIPRSGMLIGAIIAMHLNLPLASPDSVAKNEIWWRNTTSHSELKRIVLVDDSLNTGTAMGHAVNVIRQNANAVDITRCVAYGRSDSVELGRTDMVLEAIDGQRIFEWNLWKHLMLTKTVADIDGVLCRDPLSEENDDGPRYKKFVESVEPFHIPYHSLGWICTTRLEKYRAATEVWLRRNKIQYGRLFMLNYPDAKTRQASGGRAEFKARIYAQLPKAVLFIESDLRYAPTIAKLSRKPVICGSDLIK